MFFVVHPLTFNQDASFSLLDTWSMLGTPLELSPKNFHAENVSQGALTVEGIVQESTFVDSHIGLVNVLPLARPFTYIEIPIIDMVVVFLAPFAMLKVIVPRTTVDSTIALQLRTEAILVAVFE